MDDQGHGMTYRRPILATDLSEGSEAAARALPRLLADDARGVVAHVAAAPDLPPEVPVELLAEMERSLAEGRAQMERTIAEWAAARGLPGWEAVVSQGRVGPVLAQLAARYGADLVAVGSHGAGRIERALLGSAARSVLRNASIDTLVARGEMRRIDHVLLATDFQAPSLLAAKRARSIAARNGSRVTLLHVIDPGAFAGALYPSPPEGRFDDKWLAKFVLEGLASLNRDVFDGRAAEMAIHERAGAGVVAKARELRPELVVVGSHGGGALSRILLGSVAEAVAANAPGSVLVVRA